MLPEPVDDSLLSAMADAYEAHCVTRRAGLGDVTASFDWLKWWPVIRAILDQLIARGDLPKGK